jgi:hypothetical protein
MISMDIVMAVEELGFDRGISLGRRSRNIVHICDKRLSQMQQDIHKICE